MTSDRRKELVMCQILALFDFIEIEDQSAAFAEMAPKISRTLFSRSKPTVERRDTDRIQVVPRDEAQR